MNEFIRKTAFSLGFDACGISVPEVSEQERLRFEAWLSAGYAGEMQYMSRNVFLRTHPETLAPDLKSVVCVAMRYSSLPLPNPGKYVLSRYAYGRDYHQVIRRKLYQMLTLIREKNPEVSGRICVDSVPVPEHALAFRSGLGWIGKHSLLIVPGIGSYVFLGELFLTLELPSDEPVSSRCGTCTRCIDACPAQAIVAPYTVDARKCLSYRTIEYRGNFSPEESLCHRIFGCDLCQEACPWNSRAVTYEGSPEFSPSGTLESMTDEDWETLSESHFNTLFSDSAVVRTGYAGLKRNILKIKEESIQKSPKSPL